MCYAMKEIKIDSEEILNDSETELKNILKI